MSAIRLRALGGALNGQVIWVESDCTTLRVQVAAKGDVLKQTIQYRRDGDILRFVEEPPVEPVP